MAGIIRMIETGGIFILSTLHLPSIDMEYAFLTHEVLEIGIADLKGKEALECATGYGKGILPSPKPSSTLGVETIQQSTYPDRTRGRPTTCGRLAAAQVVQKLQSLGITDKAIFLSWHISFVDVLFKAGLSRKNSKTFCPRIILYAEFCWSSKVP